jgi:hypothetical protein
MKGHNGEANVEKEEVQFAMTRKQGYANEE